MVTLLKFGNGEVIFLPVLIIGAFDYIFKTKQDII